MNTQQKFKYLKGTIPENLNTNVIHSTYCIAKGGTGASNHYWMSKNQSILKNITQIDGTPVCLHRNVEVKGRTIPPSRAFNTSKNGNHITATPKLQPDIHRSAL